MTEARAIAAGETPGAAPALVNLAPSAKARQSSVSRWSLGDDASGALRPHRRPFGFHTDLDDGPWWTLELAVPARPERVVVHNRRDMLQERASALIVEASLDGVAWTLLHQGLCHFGGGDDDGDGTPLVLPLAGKLELRFLRLRLPDRGHLHLGWVEIWVREAAAAHPCPRQEMLFLAARSDGFGVRLRALVNAIVLAEHFGGDFRVAWPIMRSFDAEAHAVQPAEQTFAPGFLDRHGLKQAEARRAFVPLRDEATLATAHDVQVEHAPLEHMVPGLAARLPPGAGRAAFARIRFAAPLERAREAAFAHDLPNSACALHLRAGDIVYGPYRFLGHFAPKAIAFPVALALAHKLRAEGRPVLVFGQDAELCRHVAGEGGGAFAGDAAADLAFDKHQAALFEITLMARCAGICAGESAFATVASQIAGVPLSAPGNELTRREIRRAFALTLRDGAAGISELQQAFAMWSAAHGHRRLFPADTVAAFLDRAIALDPANALYRLVRIREDLVAGRRGAADRALFAAAHEDRRDSLVFLLTGYRNARFVLPRMLVKSFSELAAAGHPVAVLCEALAAADPAAAKAAARRFQAARPQDLAIYDPEVARVLAA